ncbi:MAG: T9SS type A sorting domain-containing protein [Cryomorphaceae bacterium]|nr:T9SS type A sorting domain-containing protein [Cryomorphaceae bacterium]
MKHVYLSAIMVFLFSLAGVAQPCTENEVIVNFTTGSWANEVDFDIISSDGSLIFNFSTFIGSTVQNGTAYTFGFCLPDGCYTLNMYDSFGDGWNGALLTLSYNDTMSVIGDLPAGNYGVNSFGINYDGCVATWYGCTDPEALNYNPIANTDDNSCQYSIDCGEGYAAQLYVCAFANGDEIAIDIVNTADSSIVATIGGLNDGAIQVIDICLDPNVCYEAQMSNAAGNNGWFNGYFWISGAYGQVIYDSLDENSSFEAVLFNGGNSVCPNPGCTDPNAINYNPLANENNGSCVYPEPCDDNSIAINVQTGAFTSEISWSISNADSTVFVAGGSYFNGNPPTQFICLPNGCYLLQMYDSFGDGWNGGSIDIAMNGVSVLNATMDNGSYIAYTLNINSEDCPEIPVLGCTDPLANNFNQSANEDDGSCTYPFVCENGVAATLYVCTFSNGWQLELDIVDEAGIVVQSVSNLGNGAIVTYDICLDPTQCYTVDMSNAGGLTGWNNGYFWINAGNGQIINESLDVNATSEMANFSINGSCGVMGCTDESALNYNPDAAIEDGSCTYPITCDDGTYVSLDIAIGAFGNEISWVLSGDSTTYSGGNYASNSSWNVDLCLEDGCYILELFDSFGDGWNGAEITVGLPNGPLTLGMPSGSYAVFFFGIGEVECYAPEVYGCTDQQALNYNPYATIDDQSCTYPFSCDSGIAAQIYVCTFSNGNNVNITISDEDGNEVYQTSTLPNGAIIYNDLCLEPGVCYTVEMSNSAGQTGWYGGYFWINGGGAQFINESLDNNLNYESVTFSIDGSCPLAGCTDPNASNFNPDANEDDGSCVYPEPCLSNEVYVGVATGIFPNEISWGIIDAEGNEVASSGDYSFNNDFVFETICLEDGCYTLEMFDSFGDGWNNGFIVLTTSDSLLYIEAAVDTGSFNSIQFGINDDCSVVEDVAGCTNPNALNYDPAATIDDGSCTFAGLPGLIAASLTSFDPTIEYQISPNPVLVHVNSRITVRRVPVEDAPIGIDIYDGVGRLVKSQQVGSISMNAVFELETSDLSSGMYVVVLSNGGSTQAQRLIIE